MPRRVKDFIDISEFTSLDDLIRYLEVVRDNLPPDHQAEMKIRGDEMFGRRLTITYFRDNARRGGARSKYAGGEEDARIEDLRSSSTRFRLSAMKRAGLADAVLHPVGIAAEDLSTGQAAMHGTS